MMMKVALLVTLLSLVAVAQGTKTTFSIATFDTGLYEPYVPLVPARRSTVLDEVKSLTDDIICLQSLPVYEDEKALIDSFTARGYDYLSFTGIVDPPTGGTGVCSGLSSLNAIKTCLNTSCYSITANLTQTFQVFELLQCMTGACFGAIGVLAQPANSACLVCISLQLPILGLGAVDYCASESSRVWVSTKSVLLLTKKPMQKDSKSTLTLAGYPNGALSAIVDTGSAMGLVSVVCASAINKPKSYVQLSDNIYTTAQENSAAQIGQLIDRSFSIPSVKYSIILGSIGAGPNSQNVPGAQAAFTDIYPSSYSLLTDVGFKSVYLDSQYNSNIRCTGCADNNLIANSYNPLPSHVTNHILISNSSGPLPANSTATRFFDTSYTISGQQTALSPEFGVRFSFTYDVPPPASAAAASLPSAFLVVALVLLVLFF